MHYDLQKELRYAKLHMQSGRPLRDYPHAAIMLPAQETTPATDLMGMASTLQHIALMPSVAMRVIVHIHM